MNNDHLNPYVPSPRDLLTAPTWTDWLSKPVYWLLTWPLEQLYHRGYWRGRSLHEICSVLAPVRGDAGFWYSQPTACAALVDTHFDSYAVWAYMAVYWFMALLTLRRLLRSCQGQ